jgi:hypothetical protein
MPGNQNMLDMEAFVSSVVNTMTESELSALVALAQHSRATRSARGLVACRGEMEGQPGIIVYSFRDAPSAAAFHMKRQIEARPMRLEVLDKTPREVREYIG